MVLFAVVGEYLQLENCKSLIRGRKNSYTCLPHMEELVILSGKSKQDQNFRRQPVYSNLDLYKISHGSLREMCSIPYYKVEKSIHMENMRSGFVCMDENLFPKGNLLSTFWTIINSRLSLSKRNRVVNSIILRSRKRSLNYTPSVRNDKWGEFCDPNAFAC
jgi:hypothetical protein